MQRLCVSTIVLAIALFAAASGSADAGSDLRIDRATISAGGATLSGGAFRLSGTVGQPETAVLVSGGYCLYSGFWSPAMPSDDRIFANGFDP